MNMLTIKDLKPGHFYKLVDTGGRCNGRHLMTTVMGASAMCPHKAVTVGTAAGMEKQQALALGTTWDLDDEGARFIEHGGAVVLTPPSY
jgi:hypothetical protein